VSHPYIYAVASHVGLFTIYGLYLAAVGIQITAKRISPATAWLIVLCLWGLNVAYSIITASLFTGG
ncbi:MAG: hypothetical protein ACRD4L_02985, partial [Pyrinomonadaceae bacterium]